jgi:type IV secretion system protein VirD4
MRWIFDHLLIKNILEKMLDQWDDMKNRWKQADKKKMLVMICPYLLVGYLINKLAALYHLCQYENLFKTIAIMLMHMDKLFLTYLPSFAYKDIGLGITGALLLYFYIYQKKKSAKKFRQGEEYGSARWGDQKDIKPFMDAEFERTAAFSI